MPNVLAYFLVILVAPRDGQVVASLRDSRSGEHIATVTRGPSVLGHAAEFKTTGWADDDFRLTFENWCEPNYVTDALERLYENATTVTAPDGPKPLDWRYTVIIDEQQRIYLAEALAMYNCENHGDERSKELHEMVRDLPAQDNRPGVTHGLTV